MQKIKPGSRYFSEREDAIRFLEDNGFAYFTSAIYGWVSRERRMKASVTFIGSHNLRPWCVALWHSDDMPPVNAHQLSRRT